MATALFITVRYRPGFGDGGASVSTQVLYFPDPNPAGAAMNQLSRQPGTTVVMVEDVLVPGGL